LWSPDGKQIFYLQVEGGEARINAVDVQTQPTVGSGKPVSLPINGILGLPNQGRNYDISPDGKRLYVSNRGHNSIAAFDIGDDGSLSLVSIPSCGGNWPRNFAISPNGRFMLVANQYSNEIGVLPILDGKEALGTPVSRIAMNGVSCIQFV
jgi:DNA-binding beta-propeller fold protein YncE